MNTKNIFRMLLVAAMLLMGVNSVKASDWTITFDGLVNEDKTAVAISDGVTTIGSYDFGTASWGGDAETTVSLHGEATSDFTIDGEQFAGLNASTKLVIECENFNEYYWSLGAVLNNQWPTDPEYASPASGGGWISNSTTTIPEDGIFEFQFGETTAALFQQYGLKVSLTNLSVKSVKLVLSGGHSLDSKFVLQTGTSWLLRTGANGVGLYSSNSGGRSFGIRNCTAGQVITINASLDPNPTDNVRLKSQDGDIYKYVVLADGDVAFRPARYVYIHNITIDPGYTVTYTVDDEVVATDYYEAGETVVGRDVPTREGYTFSGWSGYPQNMTMPAGNVTVSGSFSVNYHSIAYQVDGGYYDGKYNIPYGATLSPDYVPVTNPTKEGYIFTGWVDLPETMPDHDLTVQAGFEPDADYHAYKTITYYVDYTQTSSTQWEVGTTITPAEAPTREGYTFSGWSGFPDDMIMPNNDLSVNGSFSINTYHIIYMVDGEEYKTVDLTYGWDIYAENNPTREGYTFSGWSGFPENMKMPARDLTITGTFTKDAAKSYTLTYYVDNAVYKTKTIEEKTAVTPEPAPTKEGYTFSGWNSEPATMPSSNWDVSGYFSINTYTITYVVDGETYKTDSWQYGATVYAAQEPTKDDHFFSGWTGVPETMPAEDITVYGTFTSTTATFWKATAETATTGGTVLVDNDILTAETVYNTTLRSAAKTIGGEDFTHYLQLRTDAAPTADVPAGTEREGSTPVVITAKKNMELKLYFRRQADNNDGVYTNNANKDVKVVDQSDPSTALGGMETLAEGGDDYGFVIKTVSLEAGKTYTVYARGTTINLYGFSYQAAAAMKYTLTYTVDGQTYQTALVEEGATIPYVSSPYKRGYVFKGWENLPETMPGEDLTVTALFELATYTIYFKLDNADYASVTKAFGSDITSSDLPEAPAEREGYTFSGWLNVPETMPAQNIFIYGHFTKDSENVTLSVGATGYNTYCGTQALYFQGTEAVKAFIATQKNSTTVTLTQVIGSVAAGTGLVLMGNANASAEIEVVETGTAYTDNLLVGVTGTQSATINAANDYVLVNKSGVVKFADTAGYPASVPVGKAYLHAPAASSRELTISFSRTATTAIDGIIQQDGETENPAYNLRGQRVVTPKRGIYIIDGKKVFVK